MRKYILIIALFFVSACFWNQGGGGGGGGVAQEPSASNIAKNIVYIDSAKIGEMTEWKFNISNPFDEEVDVHVLLATDDGVTSDEIFTIFSGAECGNLSANSFVLKQNEECKYYSRFTPKELKYYTGVVSIDIIGKSVYETGKIANKRRMDVYLNGAGAIDPKDAAAIHPSDYIVNFNGVNGYYYNNSAGEYNFNRPDVTLTFKNTTPSDTTYTLDGNSDEFKLKFKDESVDCKIVEGNKFYLGKDAACNLNFEYVPRSKIERGQLYIIPANGAAIQRLFFIGDAYPFRFMKNGDSMDWGEVGVNFKLADTLLDLKEKIAFGEKLTENFENTFDALIMLQGKADNETRYKLDFDQTKNFSIDQRLTSCALNSENTLITIPKGGQCNIIVEFTPQEPVDYNSTLTVTEEVTQAVSSYNFKGKGANMRRPDIVPYTLMSTGGQSYSLAVGGKYYYAVELHDNSTYSLTGDLAVFKIENLYPTCENKDASFQIPLGASKCRVYLSFSPPALQAYSATLKIKEGTKDEVSYKIDGTGI